MEDGQPKVSLCDEKVKEKEQKKAELDEKIKALKKKNEALVQRHREIEEDQLRAEKDGRAVTSRRSKQDSLTITITKNPNEKRIVRKARRSSDGTEQRFTFLMGNEMQLSVSMDRKVKGMKTISKKSDQNVLFRTSKTSKLSMEEVNNVFTFGRGPHMQIAISRQNPGKKYEMSCSDNPLTMAAAKQSEYLQWKKEREQADNERLARQKNSRGEWRRAWDKGKTDEMFEGDICYVHTVPRAFCDRRGAGKQICNEKTPRMMNTMSSSAKGTDRLTGRAQRWYSIDHEDFSYMPEDSPVPKSLDNKVTVKHSEGNFTEDEFLDTEKLVQNNSLGDEEKIVFANEKILQESKQDVPFHGKKMEVASDDLLSEGREMLEYLSVLSCESENSEN